MDKGIQASMRSMLHSESGGEAMDESNRVTVYNRQDLNNATFGAVVTASQEYTTGYAQDGGTGQE